MINSKHEALKIGGWLYLPIFMLIITQFVMIPKLLIYIKWITNGTYALLTTPGTNNYIASFRLLSTAEFIIIFSELLLPSFLLYKIFRKRKSAPALMILYLMYLIIIKLILFYLLTHRGGESPSMGMGLIRSILSGFIWIPYFINSKRVKNTFIN